MKHYYREPKVEEAVSSIVLQNRCGSRLTLLLHPNFTELEFIYKPNAFRRHEFRARNFSNRDNFTSLLAEALLPETGVEAVTRFDYDPFITRISTEIERARGDLTFVNLPTENAFVIASRCPLLLTFRPRREFQISDGLLTETFTDRGETIVSFIQFDSFENNRFRLLDDGRAVLQLVENDYLIIGGEENSYQVNQALKSWAGLTLKEVEQRVEHLLAPALSTAQLTCTDPVTQRIADLNKRIIYSGIDAGGACFGALNRIYHLIWLRDGALTTSTLARAGFIEPLRLWTPFILNNPSRRRAPDGRIVSEYLQVLGSKWTKNEDDGLYYAVLSLFTLYETTGDPALLHPSVLKPLLDAADYAIKTRFDPYFQLFMSDTRGETTLASSPHFGYDSVTGERQFELTSGSYQGREIWRAGTLYQNVNYFNVLRMLHILLDAAGGGGDSYMALAELIQDTLQRRLVTPEGVYYCSLLQFEDGSLERDTFEQGDPWEYAWAISVGPFTPDIAIALRSAHMVYTVWPKTRSYGYCPWNYLSRFLKEFGLSSADYCAMLADEIREAMLPTTRYPLYGALTEYQGQPEGWRALPFSAASFIGSLTSTALQWLPRGLAVRAGDVLTRIENAYYRTHQLDVRSAGEGDAIINWRLNGRDMPHTLQIPENALRTGRNTLEIACGAAYTGSARLYGSSARLFGIELTEYEIAYRCSSIVPCDLFFEGFTHARITDMQGRELPFKAEPIGFLTWLSVAPHGDFTVYITP